MAWQDMFAGSTPRINAEYEQELHLADQARMGADWALGALIARYQPTVTRYLTRLTGDASRARLLGEQIFLRMERRLHGPHGGQHLRLWLLRASTELGLDELRRPYQTTTQVQLESSSPRPRALLPGVLSSEHYDERPAPTPHQTDTSKTASPSGRRGTTRRQLRQLIWSPRSDPSATAPADETFSAATDTKYQDPARGRRRPQAASSPSVGQLWDGVETDFPAEEEEILDPREVLRYRMIRAVLAELPYGDAQCLALHLVASLNQAEVARALGITATATRKRIVSGLQLFAQRYEAASASLGISLDTLEVGHRTEVTEEEEEIFALPAQRGDEATPPPPPSHREPVIVSAPATNPLLPPPVSAGEETVVVWDLPPFDDLVNVETQPLPDATEPSESPAAQEEPGGTSPEEEITRRLVWSRPAVYRQTPVPSGDDVTTRLEKPRRRSAATTGDISSGAARTHPGGGKAGHRVEEAWTFTENIETISEPPPEALVVDAGPPTVPTRTVPILTTFDEDEPHRGADHEDDSPPSGQGSSRSIAGDRARVISVLTPNAATSPGDKSESNTGPKPAL